ncbi:MAG: hypothetical protein Q9192_007663, partial [Flavoplaca navasiana]
GGFAAFEVFERSVGGRVEIECCASDEGRCETPGHADEEEAEGPADDGGGGGGVGGGWVGHCVARGNKGEVWKMLRYEVGVGW